MQKVLNSLIF